MMVCCAESSKPDYSKILSISSAYDTFTIFIFCPFLSFYFIIFSLLGLSQINLNYIIILSTALSCQFNIRSKMRRLCLPFFSVYGLIFMGTQGYRVCLSFLFLDQSLWAHEEIVLAFLFFFWIGIRLVTLLSDCSLLSHVTDMSTLLQRFRWDHQSRYFLVPVIYCCTVSTQSRRWWSLCLAYIAKSLSCNFPVELQTWFSTVPCLRSGKNLGISYILPRINYVGWSCC